MMKKMLSLALGVVMSLSLVTSSVMADATMSNTELELAKVVQAAKDGGMTEQEIATVAAEFGVPGLEAVITALSNVDPVTVGISVVAVATLAFLLQYAKDRLPAQLGRFIPFVQCSTNRATVPAAAHAAAHAADGKEE